MNNPYQQPQKQNKYQVGYYEEFPVEKSQRRHVSTDAKRSSQKPSRKNPRKELKTHSMKSRTISPVNLPSGNSNLRQPLAFIRQTNTGSLGPPKNRHQYEEDAPHHVNSTAIFPGGNQFQTYGSGNQFLSSIEHEGDTMNICDEQEEFQSPQEEPDYEEDPQYYYNDTDEINRSYEKIRDDYRVSKSSQGFGSSAGKQGNQQRMHSREISFQQLNGFNRGIQILSSQKSPPNAPRQQMSPYPQDSRNMNIASETTDQNIRSIQKSSNRSKSMDIATTHFRQNSQDNKVVLNFNGVTSPLNRQQNPRIKSSSPRNYREQPIGDMRNYDTKSEKIVASPRFSQNTDENAGYNNRDIQRMSRKRSRNHMDQIQNQMSEEYLYEDQQREELARTSQGITSGREGLNMNFNTQDLMHLTTPEMASNRHYGQYDTRDNKNNYRSLQPSGLGTVVAGNQYGLSSENYPTSSMGMTNDARLSESIYQTQQFQQRHDTFRDEGFINQQRQFDTHNNFVSRAQNQGGFFSPDTNNTNMGNLTLSDLNQSNRNHMLGNTGSNQFQKTTVLNNIPNNMRTLESQENKSQKLNNLRFHSFVEKLWVKKRLIQIHQNICQKRCNYKDYTHFDLLDEIDQLTTNQHVSQGLSKLSDIDSHFQISRQDMSYQTAINPRQMRTLNPQISSSSMTELDDLRKQREDSEAIINNLRKTIKDMARQMKQMEIKLDSNSLGNISPKARSQVVSREKLDQMGSQYMMYELEQKNQEIDDIKTEHGNYTRQLKDKFKDKFNEQNKFIDELKAELAKKSSSFEVQRLENQVSMLQRQITMQRNQASTDIKMHESDQIRLQSSKEQEKHWKCGYESIFQKYTQLKDQMTKREDEIRRKEWDNETKFKALTRKAEEAINYFKNLAMKQEMRQGRFNETSRSTLQDDYKLRSRSANLGLEPIDDLKIKQYQSSTLTRAGQINPAKEYLGTTHKSYLSTQKQDYIRPHSNHCSTKKSYSPIRSEKNGMAIRFRGNEIRGSSQEYQGMLSPKAQQKMNFIERIQSDLTKETEKSTCNTKLFLALEALEKSFLEINKYKRETTDLSMKYFARNCDHLQDFQVLSYDYMSQIDQHLAREATLQKELAKKDTQISSLRDIISQSKRIIQSLLEQIKEQKQIKELQWKNIIQYDTVKDQEKKRVDETIDQEMQIGKKIIQDLHTEILGRESMIDNKNNVIQHLEEQKHQIQNSMSQLRSTHDDTLQHLQIVQDEKQDLEKRLEMIQEQIKQILFGTCGVPEGEVYQPTTQRQMLSEQKQMYINHDSENMLEGQMTPQLRSEFSAAGEFVINSNRYQGSPAQIENQMQSFEHLNHINQCINGLLQRILNDGQYIASLNQIVDEEQVQQSNTQETGDFKPHQETFKSQSLDSFINNQQRQYPNESQSQDLRAFVQTQYTQQNIPERESLDQVDEGSVCQSDAPDVDRCTLQQKLQQLITANQLKGETIEQLQNEIQKVNEEYNNLDHHTSVAMNDLHMEIKKLTSEKEQLNQVYQQENQMRQELEGLCEEKSMAIDEAKQQISQCEMDLEHLQEQHDNVATEKERLTQSNEYWQNSFKLIESHFLEQKEKAKKEMNRLNDEINKYESDLIQKNSNIGRMQDHIKTLEEELLPLKRAKHDSRVATCQTDVKFTQIESLFRLEDENNQIKADIQHLIESYENFKNDSSKTQKNLQDRINQLENQKRTQQTYEADRLSHQLLSSQQHVQDLQNQLSNVEKDKEEAELQLISQKDQIDQLTQFNQVVQNFNQQLQMQLQSYSSFNTTNQANQNSAKYFNQGTDREQFQTYDQEQRNSQFSFLDGQRQKINNASQSQSFTNTMRVAQNQLTSMSNGQSNRMTPAPYQQDRDHDTSLGLDMCQQCIEHESTIQSQQDQIRKLITNQVQSTRKLTSMCMEGAILLRSESIKVKEHNIQSRKRNQSYDFERVNLSTISEPEQKTQSIRQAQKFLEKNLEYFMGASATKKLLKYSDTMINIAQHIVQNSCEIQMKYQQSVLNRTSSLKIDDYHSDQFSDKACQIELRDKTESTGREMRVDTLTGEPAVLSGNRNEAIVYRKTVPDHVIQKIEYLGVSLDNKIGIFVKLLGSIKKLSKDDRIKKMMQALTGTISKAIHDLTLDTEQLNDIKSELENQQVTESSLSHHLPLNKEKWEDARETAAFQKSSSASETQKVRIQPQTIMQMNFVNEDGRTLTDTNRSKIHQNPQMFKNYNYHITNSSKTIALSKGVNSSPFLNTENNVSNRQYYEDAVAQKFVPPVNEETETDSEIQQYPLNDTGGMETLIQDISHHFKDKCTLSPRAFLNQSSNANSNQELEKCRSYMKTINDQQNMLNNMSSNYKYHGALHNTLDTSNVSNKGPVSNFAKRQYGMNLNQTISQPPKHQHHISLRDPNIVSSQNFNNQSLLVEQENNFNSLDPRKKTNYERSHSFQKFGTSSVSISNYSDFKK